MSNAAQMDTLKIVTNPPALEQRKASEKQQRATCAHLQPRKHPRSHSSVCEEDVATITSSEQNQKLQITTASKGGELKRYLPFKDTLTPKKAKKEQNINTQHATKISTSTKQSVNSERKLKGVSNKNVSSKAQQANIILGNDEAQFNDMPLGVNNGTAQDPPHGNTDRMIDATGILHHISHRQRDFPKLRSVLHIDYFRFVNVDKIQSFREAVNAVHSALQTLLDGIKANISPGDFVQLRLTGGNSLDHVFSSKHSTTNLKAEVFLNSAAKTLQSNEEGLRGATLKLTATILKNRRGGVKRHLKSIAYSQIIKQKRQWLYDFNNYNSNLCLAASISALIADSDISDAIIMARATQLFKDLSIPHDQLVSFDDIAKFEKHLGINIKVLYHNQDKWQYFHTKLNQTGKNVYILHHDNHYYGIKNVKGFLGEAYFCQQCSSVFHHKNNHSCKYFCKACQKDNCMESADDQPKCPKCRIFCRSSECFEEHKRLASDNKIFCKAKTFCDSCMRYVGSEIDHECRNPVCNVCGVSLDRYASHQCYMPPYIAPEKTDKYIFYDYRCQMEKDVCVPNFVCCSTLHGDITWEFEGKRCLQKFVQLFTNGKFHGFTFIAHDGDRYDARFVVQALIKEKLQVKLSTRGPRLFCMILPDLNIRFIDFLNFLPVNFGNLPTAMGFPVLMGYFPHSFNTETNQTYVGPLPPMEFYDVAFMTPGDREVFTVWYKKHKNTTFNLKSELSSHCSQAVEVLRKACERYRDLVMEMSKKQVTTYCNRRERNVEVVECVDPFQLISLPSVCMAMYRFNFLSKETIAVLPGDNYHKTQKRTSSPAIQWLLYVTHTENITIRHALSGGEKQVGKYSLDGYARVSGQEIAFEYLPCTDYGCQLCRKKIDCSDAPKSHYSQTYQTFRVKKQYLLRCGFTVRAICENQWNEMLENKRKLQDFLRKKQLPTQLDPWDALYGGRTNTTKLYHKVTQGETIHHYHITSLYPFVNQTKTYPMGHPEIIFENIGPIGKYFGIAKVKIYPPRGLLFPVLPIKINKKLVFTLCYSCAANPPKRLCSHKDEERSLTGTWCTIELQMALEKGYRIGHIYEIWNFPNTADELFASYIKLHRRDHGEALDYPSWCANDDKKSQCIDTVLEKEGIQLRADNIKADAAKRQISDLFINSLWGTFGQRSDFQKTNIVTDPDELFRYVFQPSYEVSEISFIDEETAAINWKFTKGHNKPSKNANVFIASFTMAYARLELYRLLDRLQERCLYHDVDSVIFVSKDGEWNPPLGDRFGEFSSKVPLGTHITEFAAIEPNTYGCRLSTGKAILKIKGMTLDLEHAQEIFFEKI
ncbi:uncharacterized protein [Phyllobates terribilis]|uniref:uncharacterized protein n=1 Tax=Phyllobates terribilis TaxID=111132 RepID=UPI003CCB0E57